MFEDLQKISDAVGSLLKNDPFPDSIQPEYLRQAVRTYPERGGKRLRPALVIWCAELLGANRERALYPAAAAEVFHNWTLVHDDIIDQDRVRRGQPTCHVVLEEELSSRFSLPAETARRNGGSFAILTGDLQQSWAADLLLRSVEHGLPMEKAVQILKKLTLYAGKELISGEALDVEFSLRPVTDISEQEVCRMMMLKTGALLRFCAETGSLIGDGSPEETAALGEFAVHAGIAFQLRDDYLGIYGDFTAFGKPIGGDLRERKITLLLSRTLAKSTPAERQKLLSLLGKPDYSAGDLETVRTIMAASAETVLQEIRQHSSRCRELLAPFPEVPAKKSLSAFADYLAERRV
jgi:geranylgeranyl diphosphate synthase type I